MIKLTKIRLINWHYISNEIIDVKDNVILTGPNASGKSTVLDALSFVLTAGDVKFNLAANEKGKRDLRGYVKCKLGIENKEYLREGDVTGHICLEFYNETLDQYFTIGTAIDAFGDLSPVKSLFYHSLDKMQDDIFSSTDGHIYSSVEFRKYNSFFSYFLTKSDAKRNFRNILGSINEDFFKLIQRALAFKPINDVKEFIYQNILEEKEIDVEAIKDSIRSYKELEATLNVIKSKIIDLKQIASTHDDLISFTDDKVYFNYLLKLFDSQMIKKNIIDSKKNSSLLTEKIEYKKSELLNIDLEIDALNERSKELYSLLQNDEEFKAEEYINKSIEKLNKEINNISDALERYRKSVTYTKDFINELRKLENRKLYTEMYNLPLSNVTNFDIERVKLNINDFSNRIDSLKLDLGKELGRLDSEKVTVISKLQEIRDVLKGLDNKKLRYNTQLLNIKAEIEQGLKDYFGVDVSVHIFAELIEILDKSWADTIEIFLGNRRFDLIVEPKYFDYALNIYSRIKNKYRLYGVGLVNTKQISRYNKCEKSSLASIMSSENVDATNYINMTCGQVIMCDNETQLEKYNQAITNDGLIYRAYTVRSLNPNIEKPYIGANAVAMQTEYWNNEALSYQNKFYELNKEITKYDMELELLDKIDFNSIISNLDNALLLDKLNGQLEVLNEKKKDASNYNVSKIEDEYKEVLNTIKNFDSKKVTINQEIGGIKSSIEQIKLNIINLEKEELDMSSLLDELSNNNILLVEKAKNEYDEALKNGKVNYMINKLKEEINNLDINYTNTLDALNKQQFVYVNKYNSNLATGLSEVASYLKELNKLEKSELITYEQKVRKAREETEIIFKEDFISKLRNNIMTAEDEISKINETLKTIRFGNDSYEFIFPKSKEFSIFYDMVTNKTSDDGDSLFTLDFQLKYEEQLDELFNSLSADELNSNGAINKFTDYRTYMDYDIKISNTNDETMLYSKVFKEKSGGETQVPFYVAIIASFVRVYSHGKSLNKDAIGLVLFDEVFDKMDSNRMRAMMEFISSMPLQIILACPPQRTSLLTDYTQTMLFMVRKNEKAQIIDINKNTI